MIRPWLSRFPAPTRKQALAAVAVVGTVGVVGIAVAVSASGDSGGRSTAAGKANPGSQGAGGISGESGNQGHSNGGAGKGGTVAGLSGTGGNGDSSSANGNGSGNGGDSSGTTTSGGNGGGGSTGNSSGDGSHGTAGSSAGGGSQASGGSPGNPVSPTTPTTGYRPPPTPRTNANVDCAVAKCIALTFDDGPGPDTGRLLDLLKAQNVPATFFVLGEQAAKYPDLVRREYAEGNEVGNHTWDHKDLSTLSAAQIQDEITRGADAIAATGIPRPTLVRPPYGAVNDTVRTVGGFPFIMWRVDPEDWKFPDPARIADQIVTHAKPGRIVLSHDTHSTTVDAMPAVIERLKQQGYTFVTVSTLMKGVDLQNGQSYFNRPAA
jgi:peptidoglycan/xylan/chitin deacetylase (PgdA/CDA1 family)